MEGEWAMMQGKFILRLRRNESKGKEERRNFLPILFFVHTLKRGFFFSGLQNKSLEEGKEKVKR
jgi:hypothetical protein